MKADWQEQNDVAERVVTRLKGKSPSLCSVEEIESALAAEIAPVPARYVLSVFSSLDVDGDSFHDACTVTVYATSREEAMRKAYSLERRNWYFIREVTEIKGEHDA